MNKISSSTILSLLMLISVQCVVAQQTRTEKDLLGEKQIPATALYGVQTARALENFQISSDKCNDHPNLIRGFAIVRLAAARANTDVGKMKPEVLAKIQKAYDAIMAG